MEHYFLENLVAPGTEAGISESAAGNYPLEEQIRSTRTLLK
jgi:hypothetical protein